MIPVTFWIKSRLIIITRKVNKLIELQGKLQPNINTLIKYKTISRSSLLKLKLNIETTKKYCYGHSKGNNNK